MARGADTDLDGDISKDEIQALAGSLDLSNKSIINLTGLQFATGISELYLDSNDVSNITPLASLHNLTKLSLARTNVSDLGALTALTNLICLDLTAIDSNYVNALSTLHLETLILDFSKVNSISPLGGMTSLTKLSLAGLYITDLSAIASMTNLKYLDIRQNALYSSYITPLAGLTKLEYLDMSSNYCLSISSLQALTALKTLNLLSNYVTDIEPLTEMDSLEHLNLKRNRLTDISQLAGSTSLLTLDVTGNYLNPNDNAGDMAVLAGLTATVINDFQAKVVITYDGGLYGTPERKTDNAYYGDPVLLPQLTFGVPFIVDGWDVNGDGIADGAAGSSFKVEPVFNSNDYNITYRAVYHRDYTWPSGNGTVSNPYLVSSPQQLNEIRYFSDACFFLSNDVQFTASDFAEGGAFYNGGAGWEPIATFSGSLDGNGHKVAGLYSKRTNAGMFGTINETGFITNLTLTDIHMESTISADGIAYRSNGTISYCSVSGYIAQTKADISSYNAAIAGMNYGTISYCSARGTVYVPVGEYLTAGIAAYNNGLIEASFNEADITAGRDVGGITGRNDGTVSACYNTGYVFGDGYCGGITASNESSGTITNCFNTGSVQGEYGSFVGGLAGQSLGIIQNCYNIGTIVGTALVCDIAGGSVTNCYTIESTNDIVDPLTLYTVTNVLQKTNEELQTQGTFTGFDFDTIWTMSGNSAYPYPELRNVNYTPPSVNATDFAGGNGTPYNPYQIATPGQLDNVRDYPFAWYVLLNDIDLTAATRTGGMFYNDGEGWNPLGNSSGYFYGVFDGSLHSIIGLFSNNSYGVGLFNLCAESTIIRHLGVARAEIHGGDAGIIAVENHGYIQQCYTSGNAVGSGTGGLASINAGLISNCYSSAEVFGSYASGLAYRNAGKIEYCYSSGNTNSENTSTGDLIMYGSTEANCYHLKNAKKASKDDQANPAVELTEEQFRQQSSFGYLDFDSTWTIAGDPEYPYPELIGLAHIERAEDTVDFAGGNGTRYNPYKISTAAQLNNMRNYNLSSFILLNNIDLGGGNWVPFKFYGSLEGNGNVISDGTVNQPNIDNVGFFSATYDVTISNLSIEDFYVKGRNLVGTLAGYASVSRISNCHVSSSVTGGNNIGLLTGGGNSLLLDCTANGTVTGTDYVGGLTGSFGTYWYSGQYPVIYDTMQNCSTTGEVTGRNYVGGLAGRIYGDVTVSECFSNASVSGASNVGGFTGLTDGEGNIASCFSAGNVSGSQNIGGFIGNEGSEITYGNCYWYSGSAVNAVGTGNDTGAVKISFPEIDEVDAATPVAQSSITTNFNLFGEPADIEYISAKDTNIAKIENGLLKGIALGTTSVALRLSYSNGDTAQIDAYNITVTGTPPITVPVSGVTLNYTEINMTRNGTATLIATISPANATNKQLIWRSDNETVATVNGSGIITAHAAGYATISATTVDGGFSANCKICVDTPRSVEITSGSPILYEGEHAICTINITPSSAADKSVTWSSSDETVARVSSDGVITAKKAGTAKMTVKTNVGACTDTCTVTVRAHVESVSLDKSGIELLPGSSTLLIASVLPERATYKTVIWSSDHTDIATVDNSGLVRAQSAGKTTITVTTQDGSFTDTCEVTVTDIVPMTISVSKTDVTAYGGSDGTIILTASGGDSGSYQYSIDGGSSWQNSGYFSGLRAGTYSAAVRDAENTNNIATASVTINQPAYVQAGMSAAKTDATTYGGSDGSITITAWGGNSGYYQYSIDGGASWQAWGSFGGLGAGTYLAVARDSNNPGNYATAWVTIGQPPLAGTYPASRMPAKANTGTAFHLNPPAPPRGYSTISVSYASSNPGIASIDSNGNVTFLAGGKVRLTTTTVNQTVDRRGRTVTKTVRTTKTVTVYQPVSSISLNMSDVTIARTNRIKLACGINPATASNKKVRWVSSNPRVASVSGAGVVTGKAGGTAVITCIAKDGSGAQASCVVNVTPIYPSGIRISRGSLLVKVGRTGSLSATVLPKNTDFKSVSWSTSDPNIATVDGRGRVRGISPGTALVTVSNAFGQNASCLVTVR